MNPIVEKVYQIGIIPVIAFNSVDEARQGNTFRCSSAGFFCIFRKFPA